ncbi:MFS transporter [Thalassiella azotivora]
MGPSFRWLAAGTWTANLADGIALAAGPLLIASQTSDPFLVALAGLLQRLPWLVLGLWAGVVADRVDRRLLVVAVNTVRAAVVGLLALAVATGWVDVTVVLVAMLLLGVAEVFADVPTGTLLPMVVDKRDLGVGNARLMAGFLTMNQLVGPALGAFLFAVGAAVPFGTQAVCVALGAVLVSRIRLPAVDPPQRPPHVWRDVVEGLRWTWGNAPVRTLTLTIVTFNVTFGASWSVLVLYATDTLGMGAVGFGLLTTASAVGGVVGTLSYDWLERRVSLGTIMRSVLVVETLVHLALALNRVPWVALLVMGVFGVEAFLWGTTSRTVRMRAVPMALQGRVGSLYMVGVFGGIVVGQLVGGLVARQWGVVAAFWFGFVGSAVFLALIWRQLAHVAHADEQALAAE